MAPHLIVRAATPDDKASVVALWTRCGLTVPHNDPGVDFEFALGRSNSTVLVGLANGGIAASVMVGHDGHRGWLYYVAVDPTCREQGHGATIVAAGEDWLRRLGVPKVMLLIRETNTAVAAFYGRIGYEAIPRTVMQKWLDR
jgi:hypothetical protein